MKQFNQFGSHQVEDQLENSCSGDIQSKDQLVNGLPLLSTNKKKKRVYRQNDSIQYKALAQRLEKIQNDLSNTQEAYVILLGAPFRTVCGYIEYEDEKIKNINQQLYLICQETFMRDMMCTIQVMVGDITKNTYETSVLMEFNYNKLDTKFKRKVDKACNYGYLIAFKEIAESFLGENLKEGYMRLLTFAQSLYEFIVTGTPSAWKIMPIISGYQPYIEPIHEEINKRVQEQTQKINNPANEHNDETLTSYQSKRKYQEHKRYSQFLQEY